MVFLAVLFGVILCVIGGVLAWRSYSNRVDQAQDRILTAAGEAGRATEQFFSDRLAVLEAVTRMPAFDHDDAAALESVLRAFSGESLGFGGGVGWADREGQLRISTSLSAAELPVDLSDRDYAAAVLGEGMSMVGSVRQLSGADQMVIPVAVPTFGEEGEVTGMLVAGILAEQMVMQNPALAPLGIDVRVVDRSGELILENGATTVLEPPVNHELLDPNGPSLTIGEGLRGDPNRIVAVEFVEAAGWAVVAEQNRASALSAARGRLITEFAVLVAFTLVTLGAALMAAQRLDDSHREMIRGARDLGAMEVLSESLATAPDTRAVAASAMQVFGQVFESEAVVVGLADPDRGEMRVHVAGSNGSVAEYTVPLDAPSILNEAFAGEDPLVVDSESLASAYPDSEFEATGRSGVIAARFVGQGASGAVGLHIAKDFPPHDADVELFEGMVPMLGDSFGRAIAAERQRDASRIFQEALLPQDSLGIDVPVQRAVRYRAAVGDVEVGGDWYDLWMIDEHRVGLVVGDVVGKGVGAAAAMGQLRSAVRAAVGAAANPADALGHVDAMTRQITGSPGATVVLGVLDLRTGGARLVSAGHLPPLLAGSDGVRVLDDMTGTPLGFFASEQVRQGMTVKLGPEDTLVFYSDGLVERRDEGIDEGIARAAAVLAEHHELPVEGLADTLIDLMAIPDNPDDVALICIRPVTDPPRHFTGVVPLAEYESLHRALAAWLERKGHRLEAADRVEEAVTAVRENVDPESAGEIMVEVDPVESGMAVVVEYRKRPATGELGVDRRILRQWGSGEVTSRGPRTRFLVR